ncbi:MAG: hypothetical protein DRI24_03730 [Deltaproteobacteria bacterium]|nr:MAG: hypothetical protein DRI24_03730 [Deltaproteobacteria bacterium]
MKTHELAKLLLEQPDAELTISLDTSTCCLNTGNRVYGATDDRTDFVYIEDGPVSNREVIEVVLCMDGNPNFNHVSEHEPPACDCEQCVKQTKQDIKTLKLITKQIADIK